ncbi:MAG: hypothetical protein SFY56_14305 [Bacteroidota bacterium]|nr:hypothetical protein [Bacteroidota bacterium]
MKSKNTLNDDLLIGEVNKIYSDGLYSGKTILTNLESYNTTFGLLNEEEIDSVNVFSPKTIKKICVKLRLKFLDIENYKQDLPFEADLKINNLNALQGKDLQSFKILTDEKSLKGKDLEGNYALFARTIYGNYYLIHSWGAKLKWYKKLAAFPLRNFECLALCLIIWTLIVTLSLPTFLITLDKSATYFCGYRIAVFFHLLIFFSGFTAYYIVGFKKPFSESSWRER